MVDEDKNSLTENANETFLRSSHSTFLLVNYNDLMASLRRLKVLSLGVT